MLTIALRVSKLSEWDQVTNLSKFSSFEGLRLCASIRGFAELYQS